MYPEVPALAPEEEPLEVALQTPRMRRPKEK
jgi:hypothetical protein